jgi:TRAP-type mannitol/chloroaromatic compound transport system permease large subunit
MEVLGWIFIAIIALVAAVAVALGLISLPDARRYLKLRRM